MNSTTRTSVLVVLWLVVGLVAAVPLLAQGDAPNPIEEARMWAAEGKMASGAHDWPRARAAYTRAHQLDPGCSWYLLQLCFATTRLHDFAASRSCLQKAKALGFPNKQQYGIYLARMADLLLVEGHVMRQAGDTKKARANYQRALELIDQWLIIAYAGLEEATEQGNLATAAGWQKHIGWALRARGWVENALASVGVQAPPPPDPPEPTTQPAPPAPPAHPDPLPWQLQDRQVNWPVGTGGEVPDSQARLIKGGGSGSTTEDF